MEKICRFVVSKFGKLCDELVNMSGLATDYYFFFIRNNYTWLSAALRKHLSILSKDVFKMNVTTFLCHHENVSGLFKTHIGSSYETKFCFVYFWTPYVMYAWFHVRMCSILGSINKNKNQLLIFRSPWSLLRSHVKSS